MPVVSIEGELAEICAVDMEVSFDAGAGSSLSGAYTEEELGLQVVSEDVETEVRLRGVAVATLAGVSDFSFVESLRVAVESAEPGELEPLELFDVRAEPELESAAAWYVESTTDTDIAPYLDGRALRFDVEFAGELPDRDWSVALDACFAVESTYRRGLDDL